MQVTQTAIGRRLRAERKRRRITQGRAARVAGVPRTAIGRIETGRRRVSTIELVRLAELYERPVEWFVRSDADSEQSATQALFRAEPSLEEEAYANEVKRCIRVFREGASLVRLIGHSPELRLPSFNLPDPGSAGEAVQQGRAIASSERRRLDLGVAPLASLPELIRSQGVWVAELTMPGRVSGLFLNSPAIGIGIAVNRGHPRVRRRFSLAHEYGHAVMDRNSPARVSRGGRAKDPTEQRANSFAAAFLVPERAVRGFLDGLGKGRATRERERLETGDEGVVLRAEQRTPGRFRRVTYSDVALLGRRFDVSYAAAVWRVRSLNIITGGEAEDLLKRTDIARRYIQQVFPRMSPKRRRDSSAGHELSGQVLPLAIEALRRGAISLGKLIKIGLLLGIAEAEIREYAEAIQPA